MAEPTSSSTHRYHVLASTGDFNGDGKADIIWINPAAGASGILDVWLMDGAAFVGHDFYPLFPDPWTIAATADFDGDGKDDILWRNPSTGQNVIWFINGSVIVRGEGFWTDPAWIVAQTGDFDDDGKADLVWQNPSDHRIDIWLMDGTQLKSDRAYSILPSWYLATAR